MKKELLSLKVYPFTLIKLYLFSLSINQRKELSFADTFILALIIIVIIIITIIELMKN